MTPASPDRLIEHGDDGRRSVVQSLHISREATVPYADELTKGIDLTRIGGSLNLASGHAEKSTNDILDSQENPPVPRPSSLLPDHLPEHLKGLLNSWCDEHDVSEPPPCTNSYSLKIPPCKTTDGIPTQFLYKDGRPMEAKRYCAGLKGRTVLVVKCPGFPASIISYWKARRGQWPDGWFVWNGGNFWEESPSVRKAVPADRINLSSVPSSITGSLSSQSWQGGLCI